MKVLAVALVATMAVSTAPGLAREKCAPASDRQAQVAEAEKNLFTALEGEDLKTWERLTDPDFVAFEGGQRYNRAAFFALIQSAHAAGKHFQWNVADAQVEADCTVATLIYVNRGTVTDGTSKSPVSWLETATLRYVAGSWRVVFVESMREKAAADQPAPRS
jgi:hypothetical protein